MRACCYGDGAPVPCERLHEGSQDGHRLDWHGVPKVMVGFGGFWLPPVRSFVRRVFDMTITIAA